MYLLLLLVDDKEVRVPKQRIDIFSSTLEEIFSTRKLSFFRFLAYSVNFNSLLVNIRSNDKQEPYSFI